MNCWPISSAVNEAGTGGLDVEGRGAVRADLLLHQAGGRGERHVRRDGGDDDEVDLFGGDAGHFHRALGGLGGQVGGEFVLGRDAAVP